MKKGLERAPHRSLFKAMGYTDEEIARPLIGVVNSANEIIPGHIHLDLIAGRKGGSAWRRNAGRISGDRRLRRYRYGSCRHEISLASRELIADSIEIMASAHPFDALVIIPNCDKIIPGMLDGGAAPEYPVQSSSAAARCMAGTLEGKTVDLISVFEGVGR